MSARQQRRLAAILAADAVGFSRMMEQDEDGTLARLRGVRSTVIEPQIAKAGGRIFKTTGDGFLVEFASAVAAVNCAVDLQEAVARHHCGICFRIGINLGDILVDGDDIFGDGVNVAARLEALAPAGGVLIAGSVAEQVKGKTSVSFADAGERQVKNISRPIRVWQWPEQAGHGGAQPVPAVSGSRRDGNPIVAVSPFAGPVGDGDVEALSLGLADSLIAALARRRGIVVVGRSTADRPDGRHHASEPANADYILKGTLRRQGLHLRIHAELVDQSSGTQIWSHRYDEAWGDLFAIEDALLERIATAVRSAMNAYDGKRVGDKPDSALTNSERRAKAAQHFYSFTLAGFTAAERLLDDALAQDAGDAMALSMRAFCTFAKSLFHTTGPGADDIAQALGLAQRAVELDRNCDYAYETRGLLMLHLRGDCRAALADARKALAISPQYSLAIQLQGEALIYSGRPQEGLPLIEKIIALDPRDPTIFYRHWVAAIGHFVMGQFDKSLTAIEEAVQGAMAMPLFSLTQAAVLAEMGRLDDARTTMAQSLTRWPGLAAASLLLPPFQSADDKARFLAALGRAGLPE